MSQGELDWGAFGRDRGTAGREVNRSSVNDAYGKTLGAPRFQSSPQPAPTVVTGEPLSFALPSSQAVSTAWDM